MFVYWLLLVIGSQMCSWDTSPFTHLKVSLQQTTYVQVSFYFTSTSTIKSVYLCTTFFLFLFWALVALTKRPTTSCTDFPVMSLSERHKDTLAFLLQKRCGQRSPSPPQQLRSDPNSSWWHFYQCPLIPGINRPINTNVQKTQINRPFKSKTYGGDCVSVKPSPSEKSTL